MKSLNIQYLPAVDHIRGGAAALILYYHGLHLFSYQMKYDQPFAFDHWPHTPNVLYAFLIEGHTAVAAFMVLSGFIFAYGAAGQDIAYGPFIRNRCLRIYPLFLVLLALGLAAYPRAFSPAAFWQTLLFQANLPGSLSLGAFSAMFWAVAVEFQFYLIFPFLHKFSLDYGPRFLLALVGGAVALKLLAVTGTAASVRDVAYWTLVGRLDQFVLGMLIAQLYRHWRISAQWLAWGFPLMLGVTSLLLYGFHAYLGGWPTEDSRKIFWPTAEGAAWAAVIVCYLSAAQHLPNGISKALAGLGQLSYSIYLWHVVLITLFIQQGWYINFGLGPEADALVNTTLFVFPAVLLVSAVTYNLVEVPFLKMRGRYLVARPSIADEDK